MARSRAVLALLSATALLAAACGGAAAPSAAPVKITVSYSNAVADNLPGWIAQDQGIFAKHGLDVDLQLIASTQGIAALLSGQTQIAQIGGSETLNAAVGGADMDMFGTLTPYLAYYLEVPAAIKSVSDLKGRKLGIAGVGGSIDTGIRLLLKKINLDANKDVTIVNTGSVTAAFTALINGAVDGTLLHPPDTIAAEAKGFHALYDLAALQIPASNVAMVTTRSYATAHKDVVQAYTDAIVEAIGVEHKDKAASVAVLKKYLKSTDDDAMSVTYDFYSKIVPALPYSAPEQLQPALDALSDLNAKAKGYDIKTILDATFVKSAADRGLDKK